MSTDVRLDSHSRVRLLGGPTPIQRLHRVEAALAPSLNGARMFVKRDDAMTLGGGGSKLRKLEFLLGEAIEQARTPSSPPVLVSRTARALRPRPPRASG